MTGLRFEVSSSVATGPEGSIALTVKLPAQPPGWPDGIRSTWSRKYSE
jgi:hypothetical protein